MGLCRFLIVGTLATVLCGCGRGGPAPAADAGWSEGLEQVKSGISSSTGYSPSSIEVMSSAAHMRISISDTRLAQADQAAREAAATAIVAAAERSLAENARFSSVQEMSVAIVHSAGAEGAPAESHTEDVVDFRRGTNQHFSKHIS
jgi:hypothetical protein